MKHYLNEGTVKSLEPLSCCIFPGWRETPPSVLLLLPLLHHRRFGFERFDASASADWMTQSSGSCSQRLLLRYRTSLHTSFEDEESLSRAVTKETSSHPPEKTSSQTSWTEVIRYKDTGLKRRRWRKSKRKEEEEEEEEGKDWSWPRALNEG